MLMQVKGGGGSGAAQNTDENEKGEEDETAQEALAGRGRSRPGGIWLARRRDCVVRGCGHGESRKSRQQCIQQRRGQSQQRDGVQLIASEL